MPSSISSACPLLVTGFLVLLTLALGAGGPFTGPALAEDRGEDQDPPPIPEAARATVDGRPLPLQVAFSPEGLLVAVEPVVRLLGGTLRSDPSGQGWFLTLGDVEVAFGPDSDAITRNTEIVPLSRDPAVAAGVGVMAPLDFFERTFGDVMGYRFLWDSTDQTLRIQRAERQEMEVSWDVVHLQGVTTVVFQFPSEPQHRVVRETGSVAVELVGAVLPRELWGSVPLDDPLVRSLEVQPESLRLDLAANAGAESYSLERPFRLVFDVHRQTRSGMADPSALEPPSPRPGLRTIVIDPGHGGAETGAIGPSGVAEKDLTLQLARSLKRRLRSRLPVRVVLTRNDDSALPLASRTAIANQNKGDLFLSIHLNSVVGATSARGAETYFLALEASDERAAQAAELENRSNGEAPGSPDGESDPLYDLQLILWDLAQSHHLAESQRLARLIQEELNGALGLRDRGVKQAPFKVLMGAAMPAVLVELGFLSNSQEEERLQDPAYRGQLVDALVRAISRYRVLVQADSSDPPGEAREGTDTGDTP